MLNEIHVRSVTVPETKFATEYKQFFVVFNVLVTFKADFKSVIGNKISKAYRNSFIPPPARCIMHACRNNCQSSLLAGAQG